MTAAYGIYLMHGGNPKTFEDLTMEDAQILYTTYMSLQAGMVSSILKGLSEMLRGEE